LITGPRRIVAMGTGTGREVSAVRSDPHPGTPAARRPLVLDVGSSWTKVALADARGLVRVGAFPSAGGAGRWRANLERVLALRGMALHPRHVDHVAVASVVPAVAEALRAGGERADPPVPVRFVTARSAPLAIDYRPPGALGADRIAAAVAALARWGSPVVVVDIGTATTCDLVAGGRFVGGAIAPGPWVGYRGLLARVPHLAPVAALATDGERVPLVGTSTRGCLRVGVLRGTAALVDGLARGHQQLVGPCPVVATGGVAGAVAPLSGTITAVDADLTLRGIHLVCAPAAAPGGPPAA
jgi:type III pantothenate kinase